MNDHWTTGSRYLAASSMTPSERRLESSPRTCGDCYATLSELRQVVARAKSLEDSEPENRSLDGDSRTADPGAPLRVSRDTTLVAAVSV